jgi:hypothetical protein
LDVSVIVHALVVSGIAHNSVVPGIVLALHGITL